MSVAVECGDSLLWHCPITRGGVQIRIDGAGTALRLDSDLVRRIGAALLGFFALVILSSSLQRIAEVGGFRGRTPHHKAATFRPAVAGGGWTIRTIYGFRPVVYRYRALRALTPNLSMLDQAETAKNRL
jgi:hypothetical protein